MDLPPFQTTLTWHEIVVIKRLFTKMKDLEGYEVFHRPSTQKSNECIFCVVEESSSFFFVILKRFVRCKNEKETKNFVKK